MPVHSHGAMREVTTGEPGPTLRMQQPPVCSRLYGRGEAMLRACGARICISAFVDAFKSGSGARGRKSQMVMA